MSINKSLASDFDMFPNSRFFSLTIRQNKNSSNTENKKKIAINKNYKKKERKRNCLYTVYFPQTS